MNLKEQCCIIKHVVGCCSPKVINMWQSLLKKLPGSIFAFSRKALIFCLPNRSNLFRWKISDSDECTVCKKKETQLHILSNCEHYLNRYKWRHDSILWTLLKKIGASAEEDTKLYADCDEVNFPCTSDLFESQRPDIVIVKGTKIWALELTVCFETNTVKSRDYKRNRYKNLKSQIKVEHLEFELVYFEVTSLGFISKDSFKDTSSFLSNFEINIERTIFKCMEVALRASFYIFCRRNKEWTNPELLKFYQVLSYSYGRAKCTEL